MNVKCSWLDLEIRFSASQTCSDKTALHCTKTRRQNQRPPSYSPYRLSSFTPWLHACTQRPASVYASYCSPREPSLLLFDAPSLQQTTLLLAPHAITCHSNSYPCWLLHATRHCCLIKGKRAVKKRGAPGRCKKRRKKGFLVLL